MIGPSEPGSKTPPLTILVFAGAMLDEGIAQIPFVGKLGTSECVTNFDPCYRKAPAMALGRTLRRSRRAFFVDRGIVSVWQAALFLACSIRSALLSTACWLTAGACHSSHERIRQCCMLGQMQLTLCLSLSRIDASCQRQETCTAATTVGWTFAQLAASSLKKLDFQRATITGHGRFKMKCCRGPKE